MIRLSHRLQYHFHDQVSTHGTLFCRLLETGVQVILLTVNFSMDVIKGLSPQSTTTAAANETVRVVQVTHCLTCLISALYPLTACVTHAEIVAVRRGIFHLILNLFHHLFDLFLSLSLSFRTRRSH
jgi:hypothetical protein